MINRDDLDAFNYYSEDDYKDDVKLHNYTPADMVKEFMKVTQQMPTPALYAGLIMEEYQEWLDEWRTSTNPAAELKEIADQVYVLYGYAISKGWDLNEAIRRVHKNNIGRCLQPDGTIRRREDGKIIKNDNYKKTDLNDLVK